MSEQHMYLSLCKTDISQALIPQADGTVHMFDLSRLCEPPTRVVPSPELSEEVIMDLASSPHNVDLLAVATYGGCTPLVHELE